MPHGKAQRWQGQGEVSGNLAFFCLTQLVTLWSLVTYVRCGPGREQSCHQGTARGAPCRLRGPRWHLSGWAGPWWQFPQGVLCPLALPPPFLLNPSQTPRARDESGSGGQAGEVEAGRGKLAAVGGPRGRLRGGSSPTGTCLTGEPCGQIQARFGVWRLDSPSLRSCLPPSLTWQTHSE